jgi:hypothetical protein
MEPFRLTSSNFYFFADQFTVPIIPDVRYLLDGTPIAGSTPPAADSEVELGIITNPPTPIGSLGKATVTSIRAMRP